MSPFTLKLDSIMDSEGLQEVSNLADQIMNDYHAPVLVIDGYGLIFKEDGNVVAV
jgi:hypothetical protein